MSGGFQIDDINKLLQYKGVIDYILTWFNDDGIGGCSALPDELVPDPSAMYPNLGQRSMDSSQKVAHYSNFTDAIQLWVAYDTARRELVGDPHQFAKDPGSSSLAAFVDGLNHLSAAAQKIFDNYDSAQQTDKIGAADLKTMLDSPLNPSSSRPPTG